MADDTIQQMMIDFMKEQNAFNLQVIERVVKTEQRVYLVVTVLAAGINLALKYFLPQ